ncbi:YbgC/FadM family acyl-CoA thioesterase [Aquabacterium lacunae]|uniref:YbgC/FadM family acyl-CoA thioesterase n=1 Tax=Aquabacterium lacunae TaxID=2528630 RepID=A0A4Q9H255_9BURK|nr:YbgC/FadM family acyl-CoA thioesterase [Aquabacterium lacunae]TBO28818.1 YbgC/FadM family acyl-CoA thioesterase [Aquabacterium lacunae]
MSSSTFTRDQFPLVHRLRVRWAEVDAQQVVFNGHYLTYLDVAISEYWRATGLPYPDAWSALGGDIYARGHQLAYHAPARLDDWLDVGVRTARIGNSSITVEWALWNDHRLVTTGEAVYVHVDLATGRPASVPASVREQIAAHAAGAAVTRLSLGDWATWQSDAMRVREPVFVVEQQVPASEEIDDDDPLALHAVLHNIGGLPLATGRLITAGQPPGEARIGRLAVIKAMRGSGAGRQVLRALMQAARAEGAHTVHVHAQTSALPFYLAEGFEVSGTPFDEVGIPHVAMVWRTPSA